MAPWDGPNKSLTTSNSLLERASTNLAASDRHPRHNATLLRLVTYMYAHQGAELTRRVGGVHRVRTPFPTSAMTRVTCKIFARSKFDEK